MNIVNKRNIVKVMCRGMMKKLRRENYAVWESTLRTDVKLSKNCTVKFEFEEDPYHDISSPYLEKVSLRYMARKTDEKIDDMTR